MVPSTIVFVQKCFDTTQIKYIMSMSDDSEDDELKLRLIKIKLRLLQIKREEIQIRRRQKRRRRIAQAPAVNKKRSLLQNPYPDPPVPWPSASLELDKALDFAEELDVFAPKTGAVFSKEKTNVHVVKCIPNRYLSFDNSVFNLINPLLSRVHETYRNVSLQNIMQDKNRNSLLINVKGISSRHLSH